MRHSSAETGRSLRFPGVLRVCSQLQNQLSQPPGIPRMHHVSIFCLVCPSREPRLIPRVLYQESPSLQAGNIFISLTEYFIEPGRKKFHKFMLLSTWFMHYSLMDFIYPNLVNSGWTDSQLSGPEGNYLETPSPDALSACWCCNVAHESISLQEGKCIYLLIFAHSFMGWFCCCGLCGACCEMKISSMPGEPREEEDSH